MPANDPPDEALKRLDEYCQNVLSKLVTVDVLGKTHNYERAAHLLGKTGSGIKQLLPPLERFLGGSVIDGKKDLAPLGVAMSNLWNTLAPAVEDFARQIDVLKDKRVLRVSTIQSVWESDGDWIEEEYRNLMPGGSLIPQFADSFHLIDNAVRYGGADIGIASFPPKEKDISAPLKFMPWREEEMVAIGELYLDWSSERTTINAPDLPRLHGTFFTMTEHASMYAPINDYLRANRIRFPYLRPCKTIEQVIDQVSSKRGISILPLPAIQKAFNENKLDYWKLKPKLMRPVGIVYREEPLKKELQEAFLQVMRSHKVRPKPGEKNG